MSADLDETATILQAADRIDQIMRELGAHDLPANTRHYDMAASALHYASHYHFPVFPLKSGDKKPLTAHGFHDASHDPAVIADWWQRWPTANIGTPTGSSSQGGCGYDVIDVDRDLSWPDPDMGYASWHLMLHEHCPPGCSDGQFCPGDGSLTLLARAVTPRGGRHYYLPAQGSRNASHIRPGIDIRGDGGYVALPPSLIGDRRYTWILKPPVQS